jgi:Domain of unknown function (DUF1918)
MALRVGDRVEEQARSTTRAGRAGVIQTVVHGDPSPRYSIRWDDGRETVYTPAAGSLHLQSSAGGRQPRRRAAGKAPARKTARTATAKAAGKPAAKTVGKATGKTAGRATGKSAGKTARAGKPAARKSR